MPSARFDTADTILRDAAGELGLPLPVDFFTSANADHVRLVKYLKSLGRDLVLARKWTHLRKEFTFTTGPGEPTPGAGVYTLPADWVDLADMTGWDRSAGIPLVGPVAGPEWQYVKAIQSANTVAVILRITLEQLLLLPAPPPNGVVVALEYHTRNWVKPTGQATWTSDVPTVGTDTIGFEPRLAVTGVKLRWRLGGGWDSAAEQADYDTVYSNAVEADGGSPILDISGKSSTGFRLLDEANVPDTGYGS